MPQPSRAFCITGLTALSAAILVLLPLRIGSQQPNSSVAPADLNPSVAWATVVDYKVRERADWRTPALLQYGVALRRARPDLSADEIMDRMQAADELASGKYSDEGADLLAEAVAVVPEADSGGAGALPLVRRLAGAYSDVTLPSVTNEDFFAAYESNPLQWVRLHEAARQDPEIRALADKWMGARLATPKTSETDTNRIFNTAPSLAAALRTEQLERDVTDLKADQSKAVQIGARRLAEVREKLKAAARSRAKRGCNARPVSEKCQGNRTVLPQCVCGLQAS